MCQGPGAEEAWLRASVSGLRGKWQGRGAQTVPWGSEEQGKLKTLLHSSMGLASTGTELHPQEGAGEQGREGRGAYRKTGRQLQTEQPNPITGGGAFWSPGVCIPAKQPAEGFGTPALLAPRARGATARKGAWHPTPDWAGAGGCGLRARVDEGRRGLTELGSQR